MRWTASMAAQRASREPCLSVEAAVVKAEPTFGRPVSGKPLATPGPGQRSDDLGRPTRSRLQAGDARAWERRTWGR